MRVFGIVLIVLNLLAGGAFLYLATQDWKGRQTINAAALRHVLLLQGLPLEPPPGVADGFDANDETPFVVEMGGGESTKTISKKLLESYFQANTSAGTAPAGKVALATNAPVTNQIAEVKRVHDLIKAELAKDAPPATKIALLRGWLINQAENYATRVEYLALADINDAAGQPKSAEKLKEDTAKLEKALNDRFEAVLAKPQATDSPAVTTATLPDNEKLEKSAAWHAGPALDPIERRLRLAHLLVHLDQDDVWQKRVIVIVGLRRYVKTVANQVNRFVDMILHVERSIPDEQATFAIQLTQLREKATQEAARAKAIAAERAKQVEMKTASDDAVNRHRTQLKEITDQLTKVKAEVDELLVRQSGIEKQLFEVQREVGLTLEEVYRLEALLAAIERERYGLPPETP